MTTGPLTTGDHPWKSPRVSYQAEACGTCHAAGADYDVAKVHAR